MAVRRDVVNKTILRMMRRHFAAKFKTFVEGKGLKVLSRKSALVPRTEFRKAVREFCEATFENTS